MYVVCFFNATAPTAISTLSLHDALPIFAFAQTKNESGAVVADLLLGEIGRLSSAPPADLELTPRKAVLIGGFSRNLDRKSTRLNSSHGYISYAVFCLKKKKYINFQFTDQ